MHIFRLLTGRRARLAAAAALALGASLPAIAAAQTTPRPRYLFEVGAAVGATRYDAETALQTGLGGVARLGVWLPLNFSVEGELGLSRPSTENPFNLSWSVRRLSGALLYNLPLGPRNYLYLKAGAGSIDYSGELESGGDACTGIAVPGAGPCGDAGALLGGLGLRLGITRDLVVRGEGLVMRSSVDREGLPSRSLTNVTGNLGLSVMLGTKVPGDRDRDGILDNADRCADTPSGVLVDSRGCPVDSDRDAVADGLDRCPNTPAGTPVDENGCPQDEDGDGVADNADRCEATPEGATVDARGCPRDSDGDSIFDGLDRCSDTPRGAAVDALGCPGDEDSDGVLDGLDRCEGTPPGSAVNAFGCLPNQDSDRDGVNDGVDRCPNTAAGARVDAAGCPVAGGASPGAAGAAAPAAPATPSGAASRSVVLPGVRFATGSARLDPASYPVLDSVAAALAESPKLLIEIGGHTDATGDRRQNQYLSTLRAEAVRAYLIGKGIEGRRMTAQGYGADRPLVRGNSAEARARNRRVEITVTGTLP